MSNEYISCITDVKTGVCRDLKDKKARNDIEELQNILNALSGVDGGHLATDEDLKQLANPNLLINGDFRINQRNEHTGGSKKYTYDRWITWLTNAEFNTVNNNLQIINNGTSPNVIQQTIENPEIFYGKTLTLSTCVSTDNGNFEIKSTTGTLPTDGSSYKSDLVGFDNGNIRFGIGAIGNLFVNVTVNTQSTVYVKYVKLELGSIATPYSPRPYAEELALCQRYFINYKVKHNYGTFADVVTTSNTSQVRATFDTPAVMRTTPTVKLNGALQLLGNNLQASDITFNMLRQNANRLILILNIPKTLTLWSNYLLQANDDVNASIEFDAEIY